MRTLTRAAAAVVLGAMTVLPAAPAVAVPLPSDTTTNGEWWFTSLRIPEIWDQGVQGQGITVAVLDSGVNPAVAGLSSQLTPGTDVTGQGATDTQGHGTRMAAFIAGQGGVGNEIGIAPQARIMPVKVLGGGLPTATRYVNGINWAVAHGSKIINMSVGDPEPCPDQVQQAVARAVNSGAIVVAAAGNDANRGNPSAYPANCKGVIAVGAVDADLHAWPDSEQQDYLDVAAPGVHMRAIDQTGATGYSDGTSDAAALTSASLALIWSKLPQLTNRQVVARLLAGVVDDRTTPGHDNVTGYGVVRPYHSITDNIPANAPNPIFDELGQLASTASAPPAASPSARSSSVASPQATPGKGNGLALPLVLAIGGVVVLLLIGLVTAITIRRRQVPAAPPPPGWPPPPGGPPPGGPSSWPPSGPPPGGNQGWPAQPGRREPQSGWPPPGGGWQG